MHTESADSSYHLCGENVLVTGASGFLGSRLCRCLGLNGAQIHAVSRSPHTTQANQLRWWWADLADITSVRKLLHEIRPGIIFHLSGLATASPDLGLVLPTLDSLLVSTVNILVVASEIKCRRVVLAGSLTEPGPYSDGVPGSPYAAAKLASGAYGRMFYRLYGLPVVVVRAFMTYGPRQNINKLIPHVIRSLLQGEPPKLSSGQQRYDWVFVDDVVDGLLAGGSVPGVEGCTIDLGSGTLIPIKTVVEYLVRIINPDIRPLFGALRDRPLEYERAADVVSSKEILSWSPKVPLEEGLKLTVDWYKKQL